MRNDSNSRKNRQSSPPKADNALRTKDVAHVLDCSPDDVIELCKKGKLQAFRVGRFWRITPSAVKRYVRSLEGGGKGCKA
jgi:excisionase family DNA binding protein